MRDVRDRLIFALDVATAAEARQWIDRLGDSVSFYKIGMELLTSGDYFRVLEDLAGRGKSVFVDLKFHDVPATVAATIRGHGGRYVVELEVDEDLFAAAGQVFEDPEVVAAGQQFHADLVEGHAVAEAVDPLPRLRGGGDVESEDQAIARGDHFALPSKTSAWSLRARRSPAGSDHALSNSAGSQLP